MNDQRAALLDVIEQPRIIGDDIGPYFVNANAGDNRVVTAEIARCELARVNGVYVNAYAFQRVGEIIACGPAGNTA